VSEQPSHLSIPRTLKIGTFHIGSSFVDLLTSGVLNRILISDLNIWATPVALLSALRYLLAPLGIWAGYRSDTHPIGGLYRLPYIWAGRLPMLLSLPLLPVIAMLLAADPRSPLGWILAICTLITGTFTINRKDLTHYSISFTNEIVPFNNDKSISSFIWYNFTEFYVGLTIQHF
jgi:BCD family chlorophyll transporter-like MFS transporter